MDFLISEQTERFMRHLPRLCWHLLLAFFECFMPRSWYAKDVSQDIVLITGAGSGLGREIALEYANLGCSLVLWDINKQGLDESQLVVEAAQEKWVEKQQEQFKGSTIPTTQTNRDKFCKTYVVDVSDSSQVQANADLLMKDLNHDRWSKKDQDERYVSVLVNNAGIYHGLLLDDLTNKQIERVFKINILSHFWTVRAFLPYMKRHQRGHIVEIASMAGISGLFKQVDYCATKFATVGFEESLSIELEYLGLAHKIHTTVVCPFFFSSNLFSGYNTSCSNLMSSKFVAKESVMAMRCNHARVLLPQFTGYYMNVIKGFFPRQAMIDLNRAMGFDESIKDIKGHAASAVASKAC